MLNQANNQPIEQEKNWCVGEPPVRWDVSFGARLAEKIRQIFWRDCGDRPVPLKGGSEPEPFTRKAA